jgi:hypothetical protein
MPQHLTDLSISGSWELKKSVELQRKGSSGVKRIGKRAYERRNQAKAIDF